MLIPWSQCLRSLASDSKSCLYRLWKVANHRQMMYQGAFSDSGAVASHDRLQQLDCSFYEGWQSWYVRAWAEKEFKEGPGFILHSCSPADFWKLLQLSAWESWQWLLLSAEGVCELKRRQYRIWLCFSKMKFTKKNHWFGWDWSVLSPIWLRWLHRKVKDW